MFYRLEGRKPVKCATGQKWAEWYEATAVSGERFVTRNELDGLLVSTVFTGIDLDPIDKPRLFRPQLFETMTFLNGTATGMVKRSSTWERAEREHRRMLKNAQEWTAKDDDFPISDDL